MKQREVLAVTAPKSYRISFTVDLTNERFYAGGECSEKQQNYVCRLIEQLQNGGFLIKGPETWKQIFNHNQIILHPL